VIHPTVSIILAYISQRCKLAPLQPLSGGSFSTVSGGPYKTLGKYFSPNASFKN